MDEFEKVSRPIHFLVKFLCTTFDFSPPRYRTLNFTVPLFSLSYIILNSFSTQLLYKFSHLRIFRGYIFYFWFSLKWNAKWLPFLNNFFLSRFEQHSHGFNSIYHSLELLFWVYSKQANENYVNLRLIKTNFMCFLFSANLFVLLQDHYSIVKQCATF